MVASVLSSSNPIQRYGLPVLAWILMVLIGVIYWQSFSRMIQMWSLGTYQHGWLVAPLALFLLWRERSRLSALSMTSSWIGLAATFVLVLNWIVARALNIQAVEFASATLLVFTVFWALCGDKAARTAAFPLLLLLFAVPTGEFLVGYLMEVTAWIALRLLYLAGIPAYREGMFITLSGGVFEIARVCAGLRFLLAGLMISLAYGYLSYCRWHKRLLFVAATAAGMVVANGIRAFIIMSVASATHMRWLTGDDHIALGVIVFAAVIVGAIWIGGRYADAPSNRTAASDPGLPATAALSPVMVFLVLMLLILGPASQALRGAGIPKQVVSASLPPLSGCSGPGHWSLDWAPQFGGVDVVTNGSYACGEYRADVWVGSYLSQEQGKELISSGNRVWPREWRRQTDEGMVVEGLGTSGRKINEAIVRDSESTRLIWYWYEIGARAAGSALEVKLVEAANALRLRSVQASVVVVALQADSEVMPLRREMRIRANEVYSQRLAAMD